MVLELSLDMINQVMLAQSAIGETADAYLVGEDRLLRSDPFSEKSSRTVFDSFADPEANRIESESVTRALSGESGVLHGINYRGEAMVSAFTPVEVGDRRWALISEMAEWEAHSVVDVVNRNLWVTTIAVLLLVLLIGRRISAHCRYLLRAMRSVWLP